MAKDKSKTKDKGTKKASASNDEFAAPSEAPSGGDGWKLTDAKNLGKLMIFTPLREETKPAYGKAGKEGQTQQVIIADVVVINEKKPEKSEEHSEVWVFQGYLKGALRGYTGERKVLGRLQNTEHTTGAKSEAGGYYYELEDADADDVKVAEAYLESVDPFAAKGGKAEKKSKPEPEAKAKKKGKPAPEPEPKKGKDKGGKKGKAKK